MDRAITVNKGVTLIELLIATVLLTLVGLAVVSVDLGARRFIFLAQQDAGVQNEANPAVEHIINNIKYGWDIEVGTVGNERRLCARVDDDTSDGTGPFGSDGTPETFDVVRYRYNPSLGSGNPEYRQIFFITDTSESDCSTSGGGWGGSGWQQIAKDITDCTFNLENVNGDVDGFGNPIYDRLRINITAQRNSPSGGDTKTITLQSDVLLMFSGYRI